MTEQEFYKNIRTNILGEYIDRDGNVAVIYVDFLESEQEIIAGTMCNIGLIGIVSIEYNKYHSLDKHFELINEMLHEKGYTNE